MSVAENTGAQLLAAGSWQVDPVHSVVEFRVRHMMIATVKGRLRRQRRGFEELTLTLASESSGTLR